MKKLFLTLALALAGIATINAELKPGDAARDFSLKNVDGKMVSLADLIVLAGCAGVEISAKNAGYSITAKL